MVGCSSVFLFIFSVIFLAARDDGLAVEGLSRNKRFLIFPRQAPTRHQFIGGIGIPADLEYESLTEGYVLKAEFFLPYNATVFRENPYLPEYKVNDVYNKNKKRSTERSSSLRWDIYDFIMNRMQSHGYNGQECLQQAICEANSIRFARHHSVFDELMHIFLSPSSSIDDLPAATTASDNSRFQFKEAERIGRTSKECNMYACEFSLMNWISNVLKVTTEY